MAMATRPEPPARAGVGGSGTTELGRERGSALLAGTILIALGLAGSIGTPLVGGPPDTGVIVTGPGHDIIHLVIGALFLHIGLALDGRGKAWTSEQLAQRLEHWRGQGRDLALLIGGPEGHAPEVLARADEHWSLGPLTLPHMLVRLLVAEQLYRAAALLANHPYHRA